MYPTNKIYIIKVKDKVYLAFLENRDCTRIKFFGSEEVIPANEVYNYISKVYNRQPVWIRPVSGTEGTNKYFKDSKNYSFSPRHGYNQTPPAAFFSIAHELPDFDYKEPSKPSKITYEYEGDDENLSYHALNRRKKNAFKTYEKEMNTYKNTRDNYPSFLKNKNSSYTDSDVCDLMEWLKSHDLENEFDTEKNFSSLDF